MKKPFLKNDFSWVCSVLFHVSHTHTVSLKCVGAVGLCELLFLLVDSLRVKIEIYCTCQMTLVAPLSLSPSLHPSLSRSQSHLSAVSPISCHSDLFTASRLRGTCFTPRIFMQTRDEPPPAPTNHSINSSKWTRVRDQTTRPGTPRSAQNRRISSSLGVVSNCNSIFISRKDWRFNEMESCHMSSYSVSGCYQGTCSRAAHKTLSPLLFFYFRFML